jgi:hypothetical protein
VGRLDADVTPTPRSPARSSSHTNAIEDEYDLPDDTLT